jgi:hypothetical protein
MNATQAGARSISARSLVTIIASALAAIGVMSALHANYVIPKIILEASAVVEREISEHSQSIHPGAVSRAEMEARVASIEAVHEARMSSIDQRLSRIEARLDRALDNNGGKK